MSNLWFTSDNHFGHKNILKFCPETRHAESIDDLTERMIEIWNEQVQENDDVWCLGDFSFYSATATFVILSRLKGRIHLVKGNHDTWLNGQTKSLLHAVVDYQKLRVGNEKLILFHYPIYEWEQMHFGSWQLHGHTHGAVNVDGKSLDVGIDNRPNGDMRLWHYDEIATYMNHQEVRPRTRK